MNAVYNIIATVELLAIVVFLISLLTSYIIIPKIIALVNYKDLMDNPNNRSSHKAKTPTLGGVSFYVSIVMGLLVLKFVDLSNLSINLVAGLTILFVVGLKDDLMVLSAKSKFLSQILAVTFILIIPEFQNISFFGFCNISSFHSWVSIFLGYFIFLSIINGYNLIDGIDGLASMVGIVIFSVFSLLFYKTENYFFFLLAIIGVAFLIAFLRFNLSNDKKIFMGDTGSMVVGFLIGVLVLRLFNLDSTKFSSIGLNPKNTLLLATAMLIVPFIDVLRVFIIRLMNKKKPFSPDRNHIHHVLVDLGWSHIKVSIVISLVNLFLILLVYCLNFYLSNIWLTLVMLIIVLFLVILLFKLNKNYSALRKKAKLKSSFKNKKLP